ncbi:hypothetical protein GCM10020219_082660 [Nonomuraea dietziae]
MLESHDATQVGSERERAVRRPPRWLSVRLTGIDGRWHQGGRLPSPARAAGVIEVCRRPFQGRFGLDGLAFGFKDGQLVIDVENRASSLGRQG